MIITENGVKKKAKALAEDFDAVKQGDLNEADTRARYIDKFLGAFGWAPSDIRREKHVTTPGGSGYIDYVLVVDDVDQVVVEAKRMNHSFEGKDIEQLAEYFNASSAHVGILTNGIEYWFFSWDEKKPCMDLRPFARINLRHLDIAKRDNFLMYLKRSKFDVRRMKWVSHADFIRWNLYNCLGKRLGDDNSSLAWKVFKAKFGYYQIDGKPVDSKYVKALFEFTKHHSRYRYLHKISEW